MSTTGCVGQTLNVVVQIFLWGLIPLPLLFFLAMLDPELQSGFTILFFFVFPFIFPLLLAFRVVRLIRESQAYTNAHKIPVWGKKSTEESTPANRYNSKKYQVLLRFLVLLLAAAWIAALFILVYGIRVLPGGGTTVAFPNNLWGGLFLFASHIGGAVVVAELSRCLGSRKEAAYVFAFLTILAAPIALLISVFSRRRVAN